MRVEYKFDCFATYSLIQVLECLYPFFVNFLVYFLGVLAYFDYGSIEFCAIEDNLPDLRDFETAVRLQTYRASYDWQIAHGMFAISCSACLEILDFNP